MEIRTKLHARARIGAAALLLAAATGAWAQSPAASVSSRLADTVHALEGRTSYYAHQLAGQLTASGERFDPEAMTMAHKTLPFGALVRVVNPANHRSVVVRVNDRGPWTAGRIGDLSVAAARELGILRKGIARVRMEVLGLGSAAQVRD
ncbi:septal ring lytic transglycosylase RlpA family protein [Pseudorhodoferax sp.]|uniref:septal ring lytic transglycosylase RlpA family protein n=1 Tax=Pseudorhodoferax sp. TaxID=1993553 RepID=UPI0039E27056